MCGGCGGVGWGGKRLVRFEGSECLQLGGAGGQDMAGTCCGFRQVRLDHPRQPHKPCCKPCCGMELCVAFTSYNNNNLFNCCAAATCWPRCPSRSRRRRTFTSWLWAASQSSECGRWQGGLWPAISCLLPACLLFACMMFACGMISSGRLGLRDEPEPDAEACAVTLQPR